MAASIASANPSPCRSAALNTQQGLKLVHRAISGDPSAPITGAPSSPVRSYWLSCGRKMYAPLEPLRGIHPRCLAWLRPIHSGRTDPRTYCCSTSRATFPPLYLAPVARFIGAEPAPLCVHSRRHGAAPLSISPTRESTSF